MNKKFLSAILLGALTLASTGSFVSCKDYDDDIKNLQTQISSLALKSDVETKLSQLQSSLATAQSAAQTAQSAAEAAKKEAADALAAAKAADNTAEVKKLEEQIKGLEAEIAAKDAELAKIKEAQDAVNAALEAVKKEVSDKMADFEKKTQDMIAEAQKKAEETVGKVADYVTAVDFLYYHEDNNGVWAKFFNKQITADATFGKDEKTPNENVKVSANSTVSYKKNDWISFPALAAKYSGAATYDCPIVVRVSPANAVLTPEMVSVVNSKGEVLSIVEVAAIRPYNETLVTRSIATGLWQVDLKLAAGVDNTKFDAAKAKGGNTIRYAIAINNTSSAAPERNVLSDYQLMLAGREDYAGCTSLGDVKIQSVETMSAAKTLANFTGRDASANVARLSTAAPVPAKSGEKIHISFENCNAEYFFVVRDDVNLEVTSDQSEKNAWNSYTYTGLKEICKVADGTDITITIPETLTTGDEIAFRIYACNYDGSRVDENGESFNVYVGKNQTATSVTGNITAAINADGIVEYTTGWLPIEGTLVNGTELPSSATVKFADKSTKDLTVAYAKNAKGEGASENKAIKYVKFSTTELTVFQSWKDNATATGQIVTLDSKELKENVLDVKLTKVLPDAEATKAAMNYSWKDGQLVNGVYTAYLYPTATYPTIDLVWTATVDYGYKSMNQVINGLKDGAYISVANAARKDDGDKWYYKKALETVGANFDLVVSNAKSSDNVLLIDNATQRDMSIGYNYGAISSESNDPYKVVVETVKTVFTCPLGTNVQTFAWKQVEWNAGTEAKPDMKKADVNVLTYNNTATVRNVELADYLVATNTFDNVVFGKTLKNLKSMYVSGSCSAKLISNSNENEDYFKATLTSDFTITFETKSGTTNPAVDVPSTLVIELVDAFGHKNVYKMPFIVKRAQ